MSTTTIARQTITAEFAEALQDKFNALEAERAKQALEGKDFAVRHEYQITVQGGKRFNRIVIESKCYSIRQDGTAPDRDRAFSHGSVHAFVERETGRLIKSAGWSAPAKWGNDLASRYDLSDADQYAKALDLADPYGSYLYQ